MYSKDDLEEIMGELLNQIKETVKRDLETTTSMSALVLEQVLAAADDSGVSIAVDMSKTEDAGVYFVARGGGRGRGCSERVQQTLTNTIEALTPLCSTNFARAGAGVRHWRYRGC
jgi:hypothetical protein